MEKAGLYNREGILLRKSKRVVDKNYSMQTQEFQKAQAKEDFKKSNQLFFSNIRYLIQNFANFRNY